MTGILPALLPNDVLISPLLATESHWDCVISHTILAYIRG
jgi:hypothetical protein